MTPAELARLRSDLAEARQRWDSLEYRWQRAKHTSSGGTDDPTDLDVELLGVEATILELQERLALAGEGSAPAPPAPPVAVPSPTAPANDAPDFLTTKQAAALLGVSVKHLEGLRARGGGPPFVRVGHAVRYPRATLALPK